MKRELTGRDVLMITVSAFAVIIGVNVYMAYSAVSTFPGLEVKNSYVASQSWDAEQKAQEALGWTLATRYDEAAGELRLTFTDRDGLPAPIRDLSVLVGRPTSAAEDQTPDLLQEGASHVARLPLAPGKWMMQVRGKAPDGSLWQGRVNLYVKG